MDLKRILLNVRLLTTHTPPAKDQTKSGLQCSTFFSQILCLQVSVLIIHGHCIQLSFSRAQLSKKFICILSVSLDFFPDLLFYTKIAFRFLEKETLGIAVLQSNGVTNIITACFPNIFRKQLSVLFNANEFFAELCTWT